MDKLRENYLTSLNLVDIEAQIMNENCNKTKLKQIRREQNVKIIFIELKVTKLKIKYQHCCEILPSCSELTRPIIRHNSTEK